MYLYECKYLYSKVYIYVWLYVICIFIYELYCFKNYLWISNLEISIRNMINVMIE